MPKARLDLVQDLGAPTGTTEHRFDFDQQSLSTGHEPDGWFVGDGSNLDACLIVSSDTMY